MPLLDALSIALIKNRWRGERFIQRLRDKLTSNHDELQLATKYGSRFDLRPTDYIDRIVIQEGYYESEVLEAIVNDLPKGGTLWDVGANFGLHGITAKHLRPDISVICFEPSPQQAARILTNAALNRFEVQVLCLGLADQAALVPFYLVDKGNPGMSTFNPWKEASYTSRMFSQTERGDHLIAEKITKEPDLIKLDIEGGEAAAIRGLDDTLRKGRTSLIFEGDSQLLKSFCFQVRQLERKENTHHALNNYIAHRFNQHGSQAL